MTRYTHILLKLFSFLLVTHYYTFPQYDNYKFEFTNDEQVLSQVVIRDIVQDHKGFLWIATENGLYKYDGYKFIVFRHDTDKPQSISQNKLTCLQQSRYDGNELLWIGTEGGGMNKLGLETEHFTVYKFDSQNINSLNSNDVEKIHQDKNGILWIGTKRGLNKFDIKTEQFKHYLTDYWIRDISEDNLGNLWIAAYEKGLYRFNPGTEKLKSFTNEAGNAAEINNSVVSSVLVDSSNTVWVGTYGGIIKLTDFNRNNSPAKFKSYMIDSGKVDRSVGESVYSIFEAGEYFIWVSTLSGGLYSFNKKTEKFDPVYQYPNKASYLITADSGESWTSQSNALIGRNTLRTIEFIDDKIGWLSGDGKMLKTVDGGRTWFSLPINNEWNIIKTDFVNELLGWAISQTNKCRILNTIDGGQSWLVQKELKENNTLNSLSAINDSVVYAAGIITQTHEPSGIIFKSTDGGLNWTEITPENNKRDLNSIWFLNRDTGFVFGHDVIRGIILKTYDGGKNWEERELDEFNSIVDLQIINESTGYFIAENNLLYQTTDFFNTFNIKAEGIVSYCALDSNNIFAIRDGDIIKSTDYGQFWETKFRSVNDLVSVKFLNESTGLALCSKSDFNIITAIYNYNSDMYFVGTSNGLNKIISKKNKFNLLPLEEIFAQNFTDVAINCILESTHFEDSKFLWIGTNDGLAKFNRQSNEVKIYRNIPNNLNSISSNKILSLYENKDGYLWIGTDNGLNKFDTEGEHITKFTHDWKNPFSLSNNTVLSIYEDIYGQLWLGTQGGLNRLDISREKFFQYERSMVTTICASKSHKIEAIWMGSNNGLVLLELETGMGRVFIHDINNLQSISDNKIISILEKDIKGNEFLWIGTSNGLNRLSLPVPLSIEEELEDIFKHYSTEDGLPSNFISGIIEDDKGNIWIGTDDGLSMFDTETESFLVFDENDGLQDVIFKPNAFYKTSDGEMLFAESKGIISFFPDSIKYNRNIPPVVITEFELSDQVVEINADNSSTENKFYLPAHISQIDELELAYDQKDISFEFASLDFHAPDKNKYAFVLEGFEDVWNYTSADNRIAKYSNLLPGEYIFRVKGSNNDGLWNEEGTSIKIIIHPPWWETIWAYMFYALFVISVVYLIWRLQLRRIRIKNEYEKSKFEARKLQEIDNMKTRFFTNISHEFRTPLTLILGPVKQIIENSDKQDITDNAKIIHGSATKLNRLVDQLMDLSKLEASEMKLKTTKINIATLLKEIVISFSPLAERKKISLKLSSSDDNILIYLDKEKFEKIINNILSNAFKFTAENGHISVDVSQNDKMAEIRISDTGIGISSERLPKIFNRFYQVDGSHTREQDGTGIGLALTKELIELHKGKIFVESKEAEGTTFTIQLPLGKEHLQPEEIVEYDEYEKQSYSSEAGYPEKPVVNTNDQDIIHELQEGKISLLIVEDNSELREFIKKSLISDYLMYEAVDGEDGLDQALKHIPDLIISDVMMPKMDGFELCNKLKTDERTSHIPVILLTAKATDKDKIIGYETGADDYIMKPFDAGVLKVRIKNLIDQRNRLRMHFKKDGFFNPDDKNVSSIDKKFLQKVVKVIHNNLSITLFGVESLSNELAVSRITLYKKIMSLVGEPPSELIKRIRLSKAGMLLKNNSGNISEIAAEVGFSNPAYFSECFKKQFGCSPSQFQSKNTNH